MQGIIAANPCGAAELPKAEHKEIHPLTDNEIPSFLSAIDASPMRNAYALCLFAVCTLHRLEPQRTDSGNDMIFYDALIALEC